MAVAVAEETVTRCAWQPLWSRETAVSATLRWSRVTVAEVGGRQMEERHHRRGE